MSGWGLPRLYDPARVRLNKLNVYGSDLSRTLTHATVPLKPSGPFHSRSLVWAAPEPRERLLPNQRIAAQETTACRLSLALVGSTVIEGGRWWRIQEWLWYRTGRGWERAMDPNSKTQNPTPVKRRRFKTLENTTVITGCPCTICQLHVENRCTHLIIFKKYIYNLYAQTLCTAAKHLFGIKMCTLSSTFSSLNILIYTASLNILSTDSDF